MCEAGDYGWDIRDATTSLYPPMPNLGPFKDKRFRKTENLKNQRGYSKKGVPLLEDEARSVRVCPAILGQDANVKVKNMNKVTVETGKGDPLRVMKEIQDQISRLQEQADRAKAKLLKVGSEQSSNSTNIQT
jgi:hypothetical protein